nr:uncharacterized protein LOC127315826 [Lolium perenne]
MDTRMSRGCTQMSVLVFIPQPTHDPNRTTPRTKADGRTETELAGDQAAAPLRLRPTPQWSPRRRRRLPQGETRRRKARPLRSGTGRRRGVASGSRRRGERDAARGGVEVRPATAQGAARHGAAVAAGVVAPVLASGRGSGSPRRGAGHGLGGAELGLGRRGTARGSCCGRRRGARPRVGAGQRRPEARGGGTAWAAPQASGAAAPQASGAAARQARARRPRGSGRRRVQRGRAPQLLSPCNEDRPSTGEAPSPRVLPVRRRGRGPVAAGAAPFAVAGAAPSPRVLPLDDAVVRPLLARAELACACPAGSRGGGGVARRGAAGAHARRDEPEHVERRGVVGLLARWPLRGDARRGRPEQHVGRDELLAHGRCEALQGEAAPRRSFLPGGAPHVVPARPPPPVAVPAHPRPRPWRDGQLRPRPWLARPARAPPVTDTAGTAPGRARPPPPVADAAGSAPARARGELRPRPWSSPCPSPSTIFLAGARFGSGNFGHG